ncbi:MAG: ZIP family metal transporter [Polaromonas sp.]
MILIAILAGTMVAGIGSVWLAALLSFGVLARYTQHMLSLAAGTLLATAFMHLLPEAFESQASAHELFATLLVGLVFFFLLDKAELWHHGHEHHGGEHQDHGQRLLDSYRDTAVPLRTSNSRWGELVDHGQHAREHSHGHHHHGHNHGRKTGGWAVLAGDSVHAFGDGILIASAFMADIRLGFVAALAVLVHEVPHHMGDLVVLRQSSNNRRAAVVKVSLAGAVTALGGVIGYALVDQLYDYLPFFLIIASSSFVYVALADLIPQLQKRASARETAAQIAWLAIGIGLVTLISGVAHSL